MSDSRASACSIAGFFWNNPSGFVAFSVWLGILGPAMFRTIPLGSCLTGARGAAIVVTQPFFPK
jgi:hypothetical protein